MVVTKTRRLIVMAGLALLAPRTALATFHFMQIEQVIGGVNGDVTAQAVQLRTRSAGQLQLLQSRIRVWDAAGLNPIIVTNFAECPPVPASCLPNTGTGARILITSAAFDSQTTPATAANIVMTNLIPASYLAAGSMTFEGDNGVIYWRLSWGGAAYTGPGNGSTFNDANGNFNPPFGGPLPSITNQALKFQFGATALSTTNLNDYALTPGAAVFMNNANVSFTVNAPAVGACCVAGGCTSMTASACMTAAGVYQGNGSVCVPNPCIMDCNGNGTADETDLTAGTSRDCNVNAIPDECDINGGASIDVNLNGLPDECEPSCSRIVRAGDSDGDCDVDLFDFRAVQICVPLHAVPDGGCFADGCAFADVTYDGVTTLADYHEFNHYFEGPGAMVGECEASAGSCDGWSTQADGGLPFGGVYYVFGSPANPPPGYAGENPPIPADFFGPGSLPFTGVIALAGQAINGVNFASTDTIIEHPPLAFGFGDLPLCDIVPARLSSLSLRSVAPMVVPRSADPNDCNANGTPDAADISGGASADLNGNSVPDDCEWYVGVDLSTMPVPDGSIAACKTSDNGGTFDATLHVQPLFVFVNKAALDAGVAPSDANVKILDTGIVGLPPVVFQLNDQPFSVCTSSAGTYQTPSSLGNFMPGVIDGEGSASCAAVSQAGFALRWCPPPCGASAMACTYTPISGEFSTGCSFGCNQPACPNFASELATSQTCAGPDPGPCPQALFDAERLPCGGAACDDAKFCLRFYQRSQTCTPVGGPLCP